MLVHLRSQDILPTDVALLQNLLLFWFRDDLFLHSLGHHWSVFLDAGKQFSTLYIFVLIHIKADSFYQLKVIPVYITLLCLLCLFFFPSRLLLLCHMILEHSLALGEYFFSIGDISRQPRQLFFVHLQDVCVGLDQLKEIRMALGPCTQELELGVVFFSLAQSYQEVFAIFGCVLSGMLNNRLLALRQFFWEFSSVAIRFGLLQLDEDLLQKLCLLRGFLLLYSLSLGLFNLYLGLLDNFCLYFCFFFGLLRLNALQQFFTNFCNPMIVVRAIRTLSFKKGKLWLMLFSFNEYFFEVSAVERNMLCRFFEQFYMKGSLLLISGGGMIRPIIDKSNLLQTSTQESAPKNQIPTLKEHPSDSQYTSIFRFIVSCYSNQISRIISLMFGVNCLRGLFSRNKRMIAGNWKSNFTASEAVNFVRNTIQNIKFNPNNVDVIISPVSLHIAPVLALDPNQQFHYRVAAQNCSNYGFGAYTGQISPKHLRDIGLEWVILGHSERRTIIGEKDPLIVSKTQLAIENGLKVIYCFGQTLEERKSNRTWDILDSQLIPLLKAFPRDSPHWYSNIVLAYEPVWAIGTGINSTPEQTQEVFTWLRNRLSKDINNSDKVRILYGGSANGKNAGDYLKIRSLDGLLIGGASLKPEFADMVKIGDEAN